MNKYYNLIATNTDGETETLYGSFVKQDCACELEAERDSWKAEGYRKFMIDTVKTTDTPDKTVYEADITTKQDLFLKYAPNFNFELNKDELLAHAIETGFVNSIDNELDLFIINNFQGLDDYEGSE